MLFFLGLLLVLLGVYSQVQTSQKSTPSQNSVVKDRELLPRLRASLLAQSRNLQRCWLQSAQAPQEQVWQIFVEVKPSGQVARFQILNNGNLGEITVRCLNEMGLRMRFPTFEGENFSFTVPIRMSRESISESELSPL
ncbi:MAG: hypothetical protein ACK5V3_13300 [Bdellovibrionales bacterium]